MQINTTRELNTNVFVLHQNKVRELTIKKIIITAGELTGDADILEMFALNDGDDYVTTVKADKCFTTKQELLDSL